ncbi:hypothetical protein [Marichromatium bheemlicum]|uniref:Uncharacterized protein n=1 Tax=Marichromatium bheemlicum TaxID=365339 RepID=A0ABX1I7C3_9GAMM|nr:hypothetical protein [Marichromatium bheemlicum]NKN33463.1 hypothetical protein [Marichromatium bheemlicum]
MSQRFPYNDTSTDGADNPAIQIYGRRFYKDQTPVEYLAEFLLVFASPKGPSPDLSEDEGERPCVFSFSVGDGAAPVEYWPKDRVALKLFAFFPTSKLDTRHDAHQKAYSEALSKLAQAIKAGEVEKNEAIRLLQSLFAGFVGVAKTRTWVTQSFLPVSDALLAREVTWKHPEALKNKDGKDEASWEEMCAYFDRGTHNFMGRGGELLFMQLAHLFHCLPKEKMGDLLPAQVSESAKRLKVCEVRDVLEDSLQRLLTESIGPVGELARFCEELLCDYQLFGKDSALKKDSSNRLGWVPVSTIPEAALFAIEAYHIVIAELSPLEKIERLQTLCLMQVLRSLCFNAVRYLREAVSDESGDDFKVPGTQGDYSWICANPTVSSTHASGKMAQRSMENIESILYRVIRLPDFSHDLQKVGEKKVSQALKNGDDNCFRLFRKIGKDLGLVVPRVGKGQRFVLPPHLLHFLVIAIIEPGGRIPLDTFYERVFAHYGIALGPRQLAAALAGQGQNGAAHHEYAVAADTRWIEETLRQGDFLVELSDAVSIVRNPTARAALA